MSSAPYTVRLDAEHARELAQRGGAILLLDVPEHTAVGVDQQTFLVGPKFMGVKMVPPGTHLISYSASSGHGDFGPTTSFFLPISPGQVAVRRWNAPHEVLEPLADEDEARTAAAATHAPQPAWQAPFRSAVERYAQAVRTFQLDARLAPYDLSSWNVWRQLTSHVSAAVVDAVQPLGGNINVLAEADPGALLPATAAEEALHEQLQKGQRQRAEADGEAVPGGQQPGDGAAPAAAEQQQQGERWAAAPHAGRCFYTPLPRLVKRGGLSPQELTALNLDKSRVLEEVLSKQYKGDEGAFLGEFQFAFLAFLVGQSLAGFAHWKAVLCLMLGCDDAPLGGRSGLFTAFLRALHAQLAHSLAPGAPTLAQAQPLGAPLADELLGDSFLRRLAAQFFQMLHEERPRVSPALAEQAAAVSGVLQRALGWGVALVSDLGSDEEDEDGPVVVEGVVLPDDA